MKKIIILACLCSTLVACENVEKKAALKLAEARTAFEAGNYNEAKMQIDSIKILYPKAFDTRRQGIYLMQEVELKEQQKTLGYLDSMLTVKQQEFETIKSKFVLEKDTAYQEIGNYFYPTQTVEKNIGRSFLRAQVNELGEMSLTSIYCAGGNIHHTAVKVSVDGNTFAQTQPSSDSYETTDLGRPIEKADYRVGKDDGGVAAFIVANRDKRTFRLEFIGDRNYRTTMRRDDVKAIAAISDLARILSAMEEIRKEQNEANLKLKFVTRKIEEAEQAER